MNPATWSHLARRFKAQVRGNIAVLASLVFAALAVFTGCYLDVNQAQGGGVQLQAAADAAGLAGVKAANDYIANNGTSTTSVTTALSLAQTTSAQVFASNLAANGVPAANASATATPSFDGTTTKVQVNATLTWQTNFLRLIGVNKLTMTRQAQTAADYPKAFFQIVFLVDTSGSMGIGGDLTSIAAMEANPAFNCAFACHNPNGYDGPTDWRALAKKDGYMLKIDYENQAIQQFLTQLSTFAATYPGSFKVAIYTYGTNFNVIQAPTTNIAAAITAASGIDMDSISPASQNWGYTQTTTAMNDLLSGANKITGIGDGTSATSMQTYVVFLSDGTEDVPNPGGPYGRVVDLKYTSACSAIKSANISMFSIWAQYFPVQDSQYTYDFNTPNAATGLASQVPGAMQSCASSPAQYFVASDGSGILAAAAATFNQITSDARVRVTQ